MAVVSRIGDESPAVRSVSSTANGSLASARLVPLDGPRSRELVFIDAGIAGYQQLVDGFLKSEDPSHQVDVVVLDRRRDGVEQIGKVLAGYVELKAVHIISHGDAGRVNLGNTELNTATLKRYEDTIRSWGQSLGEQADILIYGCNLAGTETGRSLINRVVDLTGADIAASEDLTGHASLGGDWDLEYTVGKIEAATAVGLRDQPLLQVVLAVNEDTTSTGTSSGGSFSVSHTTSGDDRLMLVGVSLSLDEGTEQVSSVTYNGTSLSLVGTEVNGGARVEIWSMVAPDMGTHNVDVTISGSPFGATAGVMTFTGVDQTTPLGTFASTNGEASSGSVNVSSASGELVFGAVAVASSSNYDLSPGAGQTEKWDIFQFETNGGGSTEAGAATVATSWSWGDTKKYAIGGVSIKPTPITGDEAGETTVTFQEGVDGYASTLDTWLDEVNPTTVQGSNTEVQVNLDTGGGDDAHGLIRFDNLFGTGDRQIPIGSDIISATLTFDVTNQSVAGANVRFYRMLSTWDETSTWNSMANGIQLNDVEASSTADATVWDASVTGLITVTGFEDTLQAWSDGDSNFGWAIQIDNADEWNFRSSENGTNHPKLTVEYRTIGGNTSTGLLGHWDFDANANDASGNSYNGTLTNGAAIDTTDITDQVGPGKLSLDGSNDYVDLSTHKSNFETLIEGTIAAWVKTTGTNQTIFSISDTADSSSYAALFLGVSGFLTFEVFEAGSTLLATYSGNIDPINDGSWRHVAVTVNGSGHALFLDGEEISDADLVYDVGSAVTSEFFNDVTGLDVMAIGRNENSVGGRWHFDGLLDDVRVYNRALSVADIAALAAEAPVAFDDYVTTNLDTAVNIDVEANDTDLDSETITVLDVGNASNGTVVNNNDGTVTYTPNTSYIGFDNFTYLAADLDDTISYWRLDGNGTDAVGSNNGTLTGTTTVAGRYGDALSFLADTDKVVVPDFAINNEFSVSFQIKVDDNSGTLFQYMYSHGDINSTNSVNVFMLEDSHGTVATRGFIRTAIRDTDDTLSNEALDFDANHIIGDGQWHTYTATVATEEGIKVYLDGVLQASDGTRGGDSFDPTTDLYFGMRQDEDANRTYSNSLDSVQLFNRALSAEQVSDLHTGGSSLAAVTVAVDATSAGSAIYRNSGDSTPDVNDWDGFAFLGANNSASVGEWRLVEAAEAPTRDEIIAVGVDTPIGFVNGQMWDGTTWTALPFNSLGFSTSPTEQSFDVAYESRSGDALLVWNNGSGGTTSVSYRIWDGTSWSAEAMITAPDAGDALQMRLAASPTSDEMVLIVSDDGTDEWAAVWDGSIWGNTQILNTATTTDRNEIAVAYESQSGHAMVIYDASTNFNDLTYQTWNGTAWSGQQTLTLPNTGSETDVDFTTLASDPTSDRIAIGVVSGGTQNHVLFAVWDGTAWGDKLLATTAGWTANSLNAAVGFESQSGELLVTYGEVATTPRYQTWSSGGGWSGELNAPDVLAFPQVMMLVSDPLNDDLMFGVQDSDSDLHYILWDGTAWGSDNELSTNTGETAIRPFTFVFNAALNAITVDTASDVADGDTSSLVNLFNNRGADGFISLREAIRAANNTPNGATPDKISFGIGSGLQTISVGANGLPAITDALVLDATTQPGYSGDPIIQLDGTGATGATAGLLVQTNDSTIKGFIVHSFPDEGIELDTADNNTVQNNWVGVDSTGSADPNTEHGILITDDSGGNQIGGTSVNEGNVLSGNGLSGILIRNAGSDDNVVEGNLIGVGPNGSTAVPNTTYGVWIDDTASGNLIGGTAAAAANIIANNTLDGIAVTGATTDNAFLGNVIYNNSGLGIDLTDDDVTGNDANDPDVGANNLQNYPQITSAVTTTTQITLTGTLDTNITNQDYRIEFFTNTSGDDSFHGEAQSFLGAVTVTTDGSGDATFNETFGVAVSPGTVITATATVDNGVGGFGDTSEFSFNAVGVEANPTNSVPGAQNTNEDTSLTFNTANGNLISITDEPGDTLVVTLSVDTGLLTLAGLTGLTFSLGDGTADPMMTFSGTVEDINTALDGLVYDPTDDFNGSGTLTITSNDEVLYELNLDADLQGYYTFDDTGDLGNDDSPGGVNDGTVNGAVTNSDAIRGNVLEFDGNDSVQISGFLGSPSDISLAAWVDMDAGFTDDEIISLGHNIALRADEPGNGVNGFFYDGTTWHVLASNVFVAGAGWHHLAYTFDDTGDTQTLYIDGIAVATGNRTESISYSLNTDTYIGTHGTGSTTDFHGKIDDARIYDRVLSATEIADIASAPAVATDTDQISLTVTAVNDPPINTITPSFVAHTLPGSVSGSSAVDSGDFNGDGFIDLVAGTMNDSISTSLSWYQNDGSENFTKITITTVGMTADTIRDLRVVDVDSDGDLDIVTVSQADNRVAWWDNDGLGNFNQVVISTSLVSPRSVDAMDFDGDGDTDIVAGGNGAGDTIHWLENDGAESFTIRTVTNAFTADLVTSIKIGDIDGDDDMDIVAAAFISDKFLWFEHQGGGVFVTHTIDSSVDGAAYVSLADINGDGDLDVAAAAQFANAVSYYANDGAGGFGVGPAWSVVANGARSVLAEDIDGDSHIDIVAGSITDQNIVLHRNNGELTPSFTDHTVSAASAYPLDLASNDIDGDGDLDVIEAAFTPDNQVRWHMNQDGFGQTSATPEDTPLTVSAENHNQISVSDLDAGSNPLQVMLTGTNGVMTLSQTVGLSFTVGDGTADDMMTFTGTIGDINAALNGLAFTPDANFTGAASLRIFTVDLGNTGSGGSLNDDDTLTIDVDAVNDAPTGADNTVSTLEDNDYTFTATDFGFADPNDSPPHTLLSLIVSATATTGTLYNDADLDNTVDPGEAVNDADTVAVADIDAGQLKFKPIANDHATGYDAFTFQVQDNGATANSGVDTDPTPNTLTIDVTAVNDPPTLTGFAGVVDTTNEDTQVEITLAALKAQGNEADVDGTVDAFVVQSVASGTLLIGTSSGTATAWAPSTNDTVDATNHAYWTPDPDAHGTLNAFQVVAQDNTGAESVGPVTAQVSVTAVNDPPTLTGFAGVIDTTNEDTQVEITLAELKAQGNEADVDGTVDAFVVQSVASGTLLIGTSSGTATAWAPSTNDTLDATNHAYWTPDPDAHGTLNAFQVVAQDNTGAESVGPVTAQVSVTAVNDPPTLTGFAGVVDTTNEDTQVEITLAALKAQGDEADVDGTVDAFVVQSVASGTLLIGTSSGTATAWAPSTNDTLDATNHAYWTPDPDAHGTLNAFQVVAQDNTGAESVGPVTAQVSVTAVNDPPTLTGFAGVVDTTNEDTQVEITLAALKAQGNEADVDGTVDAFVVQSVASGTLLIGTSSGTATAWAPSTNDTLDATNHAYWTPDPDAHGTLNAFQVVAQDNTGAESVGPVTAQVSVTAVNDPPTLTGFAGVVDTTNEDTQVEITLAALKAQGNEADVDGTVDAFVVQSVASGTLLIGTSSGTATAWAPSTNDTVDATNHAYWTPDPDAHGTLNAFQVVAQDNTGAESVGPVTAQVSVTAVNDPPTLTGFAGVIDTTNEDTQVEITLAALKAQGDEADVDGTVDAFVVQSVASGTLLIGTSSGTATAWAPSTNDTVDATNHAYWTPDPDAHGTLNAFQVVAQDNTGAESVGPVTAQVSVTAVNDPPTLTGFAGVIDTTNEDTQVEITLAELKAQGNEADVDGTVDAFVVQSVASGTLLIGTSSGTATAWAPSTNDTLDATNHAYWTPDPDAHGTLNAFQVVAQDNTGAESVGPVTAQVSVTAVNDPPTLTGFAGVVDTTNEDTQVEITLAALKAQGDEADVDGTVDAFVVQSVASGTLLIGTSSGTATAWAPSTNDTLDATNHAYWTPDPDAHGTLNAFQVVAQDNTGAESVGPVTAQVSVTAVNDPPTLTGFAGVVDTTNEDTQVEITLAALKAQGNEADVDGTVDAFVVQSVASGTLLIGTSSGTATAWAPSTNDTVDATNHAYWTPDPDAHGTLNAFQVVAQDNTGAESVGPVTAQVSVTAVNDPPTLTGFAGVVDTTNEDTQVEITLAALKAQGNEADVDGTVDAFVVQSVASGTLLIGTSSGTATAWAPSTNDTVDATNHAYWTPDPDAHGTLNAFQVVAQDNTGAESVGPVTAQVSVTAVNDPPTLTGFAGVIDTTNEDTQVEITLAALKAQGDEADVDGTVDAFVVQSVASGTLLIGTSSGTATAWAPSTNDTLDATNHAYWTPDPDAHGTLNAFQVVAQDNTGAESVGPVTAQVSVTAVNDPPTLTGFAGVVDTTNEDTQVEITLAALKAQGNEADVDGTVDAFVVQSVASGTLLIGTSSGTATAWAPSTNDTVDATNHAYWTPDPDAHGTLNAFQVVAQDNTGAESVGPVTAQVSVTAVNDPPTLTGFAGVVDTTNEDTQVEITLAALKAQGNEADVDGTVDAFVVQSVASGTLLIGTSSGTATAWAPSTNDTVDATNHAYWTPDPDAHGTLNAFQVVAQDNTGAESVGPVTAQVSVTAVNDPPTLTGFAGVIDTTNEDTQVEITLAELKAQGNEADVDGTVDAFVVQSVASGTLLIGTSSGTATAWAPSTNDTLDATNHAYWTPDPDAHGTLNAFQVVAQDNTGAESVGPVTAQVSVTAVNDPPTLTGFAGVIDTTNEDTQVEITLAELKAQGDEADVDGTVDAFVVQSVASGTLLIGTSSGTATAWAPSTNDTLDATNHAYWTPDPDAHGTLNAFQVVAQDNTGAESVGPVTAQVSVTAVNDPPTLTGFAGVVDTTNEDTQVEITLAALKAQGDEADVDGTVDAFVVQSVASGTLLIGTSSGTATAWAPSTNDTVDATNHAYWTPDPDAHGTLNAFQVVAQDNTGAESVGPVTAQVSVTAVNDPPTLTGFAGVVDTTNEDTQVEITLAALKAQGNEADVDGTVDAFVVQSVASGTLLIGTSSGTATAWAPSTNDTVDATNHAYWTPDPDAHGTLNAFQVVAQDNTGAESVGPVTAQVSVTAVNDPPTLTGFAGVVDTTNEDTQVEITLAALKAQGNEADVDGTVDAFVVQSVASGTLLIGTSSGTATAWAPSTNDTVDATNHAYWTPDPDAHGTLNAFQVVAQDNTGAESVGPVTAQVSVTAVNDPPTLTGFAGVIDTTNEDTQVEITLAELKAQGDEADVDGTVDAFVVQSVASGTLLIGTSSGTATAWAPSTNDTLDATNHAYWTPDPDAHGTLNAFQVVAQDNTGAESVGPVTAQVSVTAVNDPPTLTGFAGVIDTTNEDTQVEITLAALKAQGNEADVDGTVDAFVVQSVASGTLLIGTSSGTATAWAPSTNDTLDATNHAYWTPDPDAHGTLNAFQVVAQDNTGAESVGPVTAQVSVTAVNDPPTLTGFAGVIDTTNEDTQVEITLAELKAQGDEADVDGTVDAFVVQSVASGTLLIGTSSGTATAWAPSTNDTLDATNHAYWTPDPDAHGTLNAFQVVAQDNTGAESVGPVTAQVSVTAVNDPPTLTGFAGVVDTTNEDTQVEITLAALKAQGDEADVDGTVDAFVVQSVASGTLLIGTSSGTATAWAPSTNDTLDATNHAYWTPDPDAHGTLNAFQVVAQDNTGAESVGPVTAQVSVTAVNDPPTLTGFAGVIDTTNEDTQVEITLAELKAQGDEADVDGTVDAFVVQSVASGTLLIGTSSGTATAWAPSTNDTLDATNHAYWTPDPDAHGTLNAFQVVAQDNTGAESVGPVTAQVSVTAVNDPPTLTGFAGVIDTTNEDTQVEITLAELKAQGDEADVDGTVDAFVVQSVASGTLLIGTSSGTATAWAPSTNDTVDATNHAYWTPDPDAHGTLNAFQVVAQDNTGAESVGPVTAQVSVTAVNDPPTLTGFAGVIDTTNEDTQVEITLAALKAQGDEADVDGTVDAFVVQSVASGTLLIGTSSGTATAWAPSTNDTLDATNHAYWTPDPDAHGTLNAFQVVAQDNTGAESVGPVTAQVSVTAVNDPPTLTGFAGVIDTTNEDTQVEITLAELKAQGDEADVDGTVDAFVVQSVASGTLLIGTSSGTATAWAPSTNDTLDATNHAYWTPDPDAHGTLNAFQVVAQDNTGAESVGPVTAQVSVTAVNDPPTLTGFAGVVDTTNEDTQVEITLAALKAQGDEADVDGTVDAFVVQSVASGTLLIGTSSGTATAWAPSTNDTLDATNHAYWTPDPDAHGTLNAFQVVAQDNLNAESVGSVTAQIAVTPVNDPPVIVTTNLNAAENQMVVGFVTATDDDIPADTFTWSITGAGADDNLFDINSETGAVTFGIAPDFELPGDANADNVYEIDIQVNDGAAIVSKTITVTVTDVNEMPLDPVIDTNTPNNDQDDPITDPGIRRPPQPPVTPVDRNDSTTSDNEATTEPRRPRNDGDGLVVDEDPPPDEPTVEPKEPDNEEPDPEPDPEDMTDEETSVDDQGQSQDDESEAVPKPEINDTTDDSSDNGVVITVPEEPYQPVIRSNEARSTGFTVTTMDRLEREIEKIGQQMEKTASSEAKPFEVAVGISTSFSVGYLIWCLRGGTWLASLMSTLPMWQWVDPIPVLDSWERRRPIRGKEDEDDRDNDDDKDDIEKELESLMN